MSKKIEVFITGCAPCNDAVAGVKRLAGGSHDVEVHDLRTPKGLARAQALCICCAPAVAVDGKLVPICAGEGLDDAVMRAAGVGS